MDLQYPGLVCAAESACVAPHCSLGQQLARLEHLHKPFPAGPRPRKLEPGGTMPWGPLASTPDLGRVDYGVGISVFL